MNSNRIRFSTLPLWRLLIQLSHPPPYSPFVFIEFCSICLPRVWNNNASSPSPSPGLPDDGIFTSFIFSEKVLLFSKNYIKLASAAAFRIYISLGYGWRVITHPFRENWERTFSTGACFNPVIGQEQDELSSLFSLQCSFVYISTHVVYY